MSPAEVLRNSDSLRNFRETKGGKVKIHTYKRGCQKKISGFGYMKIIYENSRKKKRKRMETYINRYQYIKELTLASQQLSNTLYYGV
jgi:hypothetical protein